MPFSAAKAYAGQCLSFYSSLSLVNQTLDKIVVSGLNPEKLSFKIVYAETLGIDSTPLKIELRLDGNKIGSIYLRSFPGSNGKQFATHINIEEPQFQKRGLGTMMYLLMGRYMAKASSAEMLSSTMPSFGAQMTWSQFTQSGYAQKLASGRYKMNLFKFYSAEFKILDSWINRAEFTTSK